MQLNPEKVVITVSLFLVRCALVSVDLPHRLTVHTRSQQLETYILAPHLETHILLPTWSRKGAALSPALQL